MSGGSACSAGAHRPHWRVEQRHCNYSAFSGYQRTPSAFSLIVCLDCGVRWRTRASYVERLPDFDAERETVTHQRAAHGVGLG